MTFTRLCCVFLSKSAAESDGESGWRARAQTSCRELTLVIFTKFSQTL